MIAIAYNNLRRLGNSGVMPENPRVGSSILSLGTFKCNKIKGLTGNAVNPFFLTEACV